MQTRIREDSRGIARYREDGWLFQGFVSSAHHAHYFPRTHDDFAGKSKAIADNFSLLALFNEKYALRLLRIIVRLCSPLHKRLPSIITAKEGYCGLE